MCGVFMLQKHEYKCKLGNCRCLSELSAGADGGSSLQVVEATVSVSRSLFFKRRVNCSVPEIIIIL